jgi:tRNA G10  N-methylase Trm11
LEQQKMTLYTTAFKGLGQITARELRRQFGNSLSKTRTDRVRDYDLVQFDLKGDPTNLRQLGTVEDIFVHLADVPLTGEKKDLDTLADTFNRTSLNPGLQLHKQYNKPPRGHTRYRVIVQASMQPWQSYRRNQMQQTIEQAIGNKFSQWHLVPDNANVEFWLQQTGKQIRLGLRLTDHTMRHRTYKTANRPASLRPTIARALVHLTRPEDNDIFLDPMCGAGTIMIERALAGRYQLIQGGDINEEAVAATIENFGNKHKPREIHHWDAKQLPLDKQSIDKIATNPPWGRQIGSPSELRTQYRSVFSEMDRVLKPNGIVAILTSEWKISKQALEKTNLTAIEQLKDIAVLGRRADIFVAQKFTS